MAQLIGIGVGPGDPDLLTVKAVKAIHDADVIMCPASAEDRPSIALSVISSLIDKSKNQDHLELHSLHHLYIQGECLYLQIPSISNQGIHPTHKEFHLYDYLQSQEKTEEVLR